MTEEQKDKDAEPAVAKVNARPWPRVGGILLRVKRPLYWIGLRPKAGSILYSPSLSLVFGVYDAWNEKSAT